MLVYNPLNLVVLKTKFKMTNEDVCSITGLKSVNSVTKRINGSIPLTAHEIAVLCNHTQKIAKTDTSLKPHIYTPLDFFDVVE
jgi:hypothetical protein